MNMTSRSAWPEVPGSGCRAGAWTLLRRLAPAGALLLSLLACGRPAPLTSATPAPLRAHASHYPVPSASGVNPTTANFMAFALNALLVPLLDDDLPPRWADPSLSFDCDAGSITVDDAPLDVGAPVPVGTFTVRWHMQRCTPFDDAMQLSGDIELRVEASGTSYLAFVQPSRFHVVSAHGHDVLAAAFTARMSAGR